MTDDPTTQAAETSRDRVRRLLIAPAQERGMRFRRGTDPDAARRMLDRLCDDLAYLGDDALRPLAEWLVTHGDGADRSFWPPVVAIISTAEAFQPRPLEEFPGLASWFMSRAGIEARDAGRLVAELLWWDRKKRPPLNEREKRMIAEKASEMGRRVELTEDKLAREVEPGQDAREFLAWYRALERRALDLVEAGDSKRREGEAA
jgi:hypothetical protein